MARILIVWRMAVAGLLLAWVGPVTAQDGVTARQILVGQSMTLQGGKNEYGAAVEEGVKLYLDQANRRGGVHGRTIALKVLDDDNKSAQAEANARALVQEHKAFVLFGPIEGGPSTAVMKVATELQVPLFGPMAGPPTLRVPHNPMVFPVRADHKEEFKVIVRHAASMGLKRVGFLRSSSEVGGLHLQNVQKICDENRIQMAVDLSFGSEVTDAMLDAMVQQIERERVDVVFNHGGIGVYERLIRKVKAKGLATVFYGVNSGSAQLAQRLGPLATGMGFTQVVPNPRAGTVPLARAFRAAYTAAYPGKEPTYGSLEGYLTAWALVEALQRAGPKPTRASFVAGLQSADLDLAGAKISYRPQMHAGLALVDLSVVSRDGIFRH